MQRDHRKGSAYFFFSLSIYRFLCFQITSCGSFISFPRQVERDWHLQYYRQLLCTHPPVWIQNLVIINIYAFSPFFGLYLPGVRTPKKIPLHTHVCVCVCARRVSTMICFKRKRRKKRIARMCISFKWFIKRRKMQER